ncbi:30S ribosomal protein S20 [Nitrospina gracilis 3/211]|uniref:Small ribosomal subunit protein bS20 n=1 Tax=Nitrospina gracilis (strain 3/211) TaxID=1266370 RepID=M1YXS4_NITG3|nr:MULTISPECIES: 30S ribosomal protein S20 [Nitrospina]MCF8723233.1 small subunit ribosomal protein S20 [Nitrospina sp. Nb-3]CCQ90282.1 30S ribosomal protein S20 [Nitrospina gracilis 3/211]
MANHKSALKRNRQNIKRNASNTANRTRVKNETKRVLEAVAKKDKDAAEKALHNATKTISSVASKGVLHKRAASRKISGLARQVNKLSASG